MGILRCRCPLVPFCGAALLNMQNRHLPGHIPLQKVVEDGFARVSGVRLPLQDCTRWRCGRGKNKPASMLHLTGELESVGTFPGCCTGVPVARRRTRIGEEYSVMRLSLVTTLVYSFASSSSVCLHVVGVPHSESVSILAVVHITIYPGQASKSRRDCAKLSVRPKDDCRCGVRDHGGNSPGRQAHQGTNLGHW